MKRKPRANDDDLRNMFRAEVKRLGSQKAVCAEYGINRSQLCDVLQEKRDVSPDMAEALGYLPTKDRWYRMPKYD